MLLTDVELLGCPGCGARLRLSAAESPDAPPGFDPRTMAWEGTLTCAGCGANYPLLEGVACVARLGRPWLIPLKEMESRLSLSLRTLEPRPWEAGRGEAYARQEETVLAGMDALFQAAVDEIDFAGAPLILDVGAGECRTTEYFVQRGARAVALDADLGQLRYLSFEELDGPAANAPEPWRHGESGTLFHFKEPRRLSQYFTRVFGDIGALPFPDGTFDLVFCRSVLHHLEEHERTMIEMARVLKPGGRMIFCAEPIRSALENEEDCYDHCIQREEGMNERVWPLARFFEPIWPYADDAMVKVWPNPPTARLRRRLPWLADRLARRIGPGARVRGWRLLLLLFVNAAVNIFVVRNDKTVRSQGLSGKVECEEREGKDLKELVELFRVRPGEIEAGVTDLPRKREVVSRLRRELLARHAPPPRAIELAEMSPTDLDRGWLEVVEFEGKRGRRMAREAACVLGAGGQNADTLRLRAARRGAVPGRLGVWANGRRCMSVELAGEGWVEAALPLFGKPEPVVALRLRAEPPTAGYYSKAGQDAEPEIIVGRLALDLSEEES